MQLQNQRSGHVIGKGRLFTGRGALTGPGLVRTVEGRLS